jgi:hypothetical protein
MSYGLVSMAAAGVAAGLAAAAYGVWQAEPAPMYLGAGLVIIGLLSGELAKRAPV